MGEYADEEVDRALNGYWPGCDEDDGWFGSRPRRRRSAVRGSPLAKARMAAHRAFDPIWEQGQMNRTQAYHWLAEQLEIPFVDDCHIGLFDEATCQRVVSACNLRSFQRLIGSDLV